MACILVHLCRAVSKKWFEDYADDLSLLKQFLNECLDDWQKAGQLKDSPQVAALRQFAQVKARRIM